MRRVVTEDFSKSTCGATSKGWHKSARDGENKADIPCFCICQHLHTSLERISETLDGYYADVIFEKGIVRFFQRTIAKDNIYGTGRTSKDTVTVDGHSNNPGALGRRAWFEELQLFIRLHRPQGPSTSNEICLDSGDLGEFALVQYYGMITSREVRNDKVEKVLNFVRLR